MPKCPVLSSDQPIKRPTPDLLLTCFEWKRPCLLIDNLIFMEKIVKHLKETIYYTIMVLMLPVLLLPPPPSESSLCCGRMYTSEDLLVYGQQARLRNNHP